MGRGEDSPRERSHECVREGGRVRREATTSTSSVQAATNHRTRHVSVDRDTEITLIRTIARSLLESSTDDLYQPALGIVFRRTCPLRDGAAIVWYRLTLSLRANAGRGMYRRCQHGF